MLIAGGGGRAYTVTDVAATLETINVDPETIDAIVRILNMSRDEMGERSFEEIPPSSFGSSTAGGQLGYHTSLAHQVLARAMGEMMDELTRTSKEVISYQKSQEYNDDMARLTMERVIEALSSLPTKVF